MAEKRASRQAAARAANEAANPSKQKRPKERPAAEAQGAESAPSQPVAKRRPVSREGSPRVQSNRAQVSQSSRPSRPAQRSGSRTPAARIAIAAALAVGLMLVFWVLFKMPAPGAH
jgi:cobalamin biosynthesis Mg chelatase CobN